MSGIAELLRDPATADDAIARAAATAGAADLELIAHDEARLLRCPAIVAVLFTNPAAPMALVSRAVAACVRAGVRVDGIPAFDDVAATFRAETADAAASAAPAFDEALAESRRTETAPGDVATAEDEPDGEAVAAEPGAASGEPARKRKSAVIDFSKLKLFEKIRLATLGNAFCRQTLLRDSNRLVAMAAIRSPGITDREVVRAAGNRAVSEDVIRYIANSKEYLKLYPVKLSLVGNPKCPLALTLKMLSTLRPEDLKNIARSKNVPNALSTAARKLSTARNPQSS
jgi:hypothetical protein